jgi:hypothetical protein
MGAKQHRVTDIEGIVHIAGRVMRRDIESFKIILINLFLFSFF